MKLAKTGTARFTKIVEAAGKPEVISLWTKPEPDKNFMKAVRENRVMSIKQETVGSSKDFGLAGFLREKNVSYLVFPKSLKKFESRRIVGIKYDLIETPEPIGRVIKPDAASKSRQSRKTAEWRSESEPTIAQTSVPRTKNRFIVTTSCLKIKDTEGGLKKG